MREHILAALILCACKPAPTGSAVGSSAASAATEVRREPGVYYTFTVGSDVAEVVAEVCFVGAVPEALVAPSEEAAPLLQTERPVEAGSILLTDVGDGACIAYRVAVDKALQAGLRDGAGRVGNDVLLSPDWWLWVPDAAHRGLPMRVRFRLPEGLHAVVPWTPEAHAGFAYRVPESAFSWQAQAGFVTRAPSAVDALTLAEVGSFGEREAAVKAWLAGSVRAATDLLGPFPPSPAHVFLVADPARAATFGYAVFGGGAAATLLMPAQPSDALLAEEWVAVHELIHFYLPPMTTSEAWLFEGFTTYLTTLARARAGITTGRYGWWELFDGFARGSKVGTGVSLRHECVGMHDNHTYWRIYWSGAFMALATDVELHRRGTDLPLHMRKLAADKVDASRRATADQIIQRLDEICGCDVPSRLTAPHLESPLFPDPSAMASALGVKLAGESVTLDDGAPDAAIRRAIMSD